MTRVDTVWGPSLTATAPRPLRLEPVVILRATLLMMKRAIVVKGRLVGPKLIELEEIVHGVEIDVEVVLREVAAPPAEDDPESLVADVHGGAGDEAFDLVRGLSAERAVKRVPAGHAQRGVRMRAEDGVRRATRTGDSVTSSPVALEGGGGL